MMISAYLLLGTNQGDRIALLHKACDSITHRVGRIIRSSSVYESAPWGFDSDDWFLNKVLMVETSLPPEVLLLTLQQIEEDLGRVRRKTTGYESRSMDIDILFYDKAVINTSTLIIPHPRLHERRFTLVPLAEIAPDFQHPVLQKNITTLLLQCSDKTSVERLQE